MVHLQDASKEAKGDGQDGVVVTERDKKYI